jgi:hypothetical protein
MPKSKLRAGMCHKEETTTSLKKEELYRKNIREFELGTLSKEILEQLTVERQIEFYDKQYVRRYKRRIIWRLGKYSICPHCLGAAYYESGYVSDRQVRFLAYSHLSHTEDERLLLRDYPDVYSEMERLNPGIFD